MTLQALVFKFAQIARRAVAEKMNFRVMLVAHKRAGQFERLGQARCGIGHLAILNGAAQDGFVRRGGLFDDSVLPAARRTSICSWSLRLSTK